MVVRVSLFSNALPSTAPDQWHVTTRTLMKISCHSICHLSQERQTNWMWLEEKITAHKRLQIGLQPCWHASETRSHAYLQPPVVPGRSCKPHVGVKSLETENPEELGARSFCVNLRFEHAESSVRAGHIATWSDGPCTIVGSFPVRTRRRGHWLATPIVVSFTTCYDREGDVSRSSCIEPRNPLLRRTDLLQGYDGTN